MSNRSEDDKQQARPSATLNEFGSDSILRSDPLVLCEIVLPSEVAFECVVALGNSLDPVHIGSGSVAVAKTATSMWSIAGQIQRCRDLQMTLASIKSYLAVHEDYIRLHCARNEDLGVTDGVQTLAVGLKPKSLFDLEANIVSLHKDLLELDSFEAEMNHRYIQLVHLVNILDCVDNVFWSVKFVTRRAVSSAPDSYSRVLLDDSSESEAGELEPSLPFTVGVIQSTKAHRLQLGLWRRFHLTALYRDVTVKEQLDLRDHPVEPHNIFMIVTLSEEQKQLADRLCTLLGGEVIPVPTTKDLRIQLAADTKEKLSEMRQVFLEGEEHRKRVALSGWSKWKRWFTQLCVINSVYHALVQFNLGYSKLYYVGKVWCSKDSIDYVREALNEGSNKASGVRATIRLIEGSQLKPPTRIPRHDVTAAMQDLIYQYGIPRYREIDPTPFAAVTFPFLFAVMFGDWGHGILLLVFSLLLFARQGNRIFHPDLVALLQPLSGMRYLLLLCSLFAIYCGAIYNEGFGLTVGWRWGSQFSMGNLTYERLVHSRMSTVQLSPKQEGHGMIWATDAMWGGAANEVKFFNSARMKMSIIFGFLHLMLGLSLQLANDVYFASWSNLFLFSLAKLVFHCLLMGYPVALIVYKWVAFKPADATCAPALIPMLISMYQFSYTDTPCYLATFYPGQKYIEHIIVFGVVLCALVAVIGLPLYHAINPPVPTNENREVEQATSMALPAGFAELEEMQSIRSLDSQSSTQKASNTEPREDRDRFDLLEHCLHCFEFLLSSLSHSASYLRLWAIGLAHGELTGIMWPLLLMPPTKLADMLAWSPVTSHIVSGVTLALSFCVWAIVTVVILIAMEGLTALLHSLRLHWIEFQSKFYSGDGYLFQPFSLKAVVQTAAESCKTFTQTDEYL